MASALEAAHGSEDEGLLEQAAVLPPLALEVSGASAPRTVSRKEARMSRWVDDFPRTTLKDALCRGGPARLAAVMLALAVSATVAYVCGTLYPNRQALRASRLSHEGPGEVQQLVAEIGQAMPPHCNQHGALPELWAPAGGPPTELKVLSYNLFWWSLYGIRGGAGGSASKLIARTGHDEPYDLMGFQECEDGRRVLRDAGLLGEYTHFDGDGSKSSAICMAFRTKKWVLLAQGMEYVAVDAPSQYFGRRAAQWMRLKNRVTGQTVFFMNHHGPLPLSSGGVCGGVATAFNLIQLIAAKAKGGDTIVMVGDFNAISASQTIHNLGQRLHPMFHGVVDGGIDWVFSNLAPSAVLRRAVLDKAGSDHNPISVVLKLGGPGLPPQAGHVPPAPVAKPPPMPPMPEEPTMLKDMMAHVLRTVSESESTPPDAALCPTEYGQFSAYAGGDAAEGHGHELVLKVGDVKVPEQCCVRCNLNKECMTWTWHQDHGLCSLWRARPGHQEPRIGFVSGSARPGRQAVAFK